MAVEGQAIDVLSQFALVPALGVVGASVGFSQAAAHMLLAVGLITALMLWGTARRAVVPGRLQSLAETSYEFIENLVISQVGHEGRRFFPFVFALFMFVLFGNLLGMLPFAFTFTSQIAVTFALAMMVFILITVVGLVLHGWHFFSYFMPAGVPLWLAPVIVPIEIISYLSRPVSLSVRLFANMLAGHAILKVFASFVVMLGSAGVIGFIGAAIPLSLTIAMVGFEIMVAFLQAYVFAMLTSIYLHDAVHLH